MMKLEEHFARRPKSFKSEIRHNILTAEDGTQRLICQPKGKYKNGVLIKVNANYKPCDRCEEATKLFNANPQAFIDAFMPKVEEEEKQIEE